MAKSLSSWKAEDVAAKLSKPGKGRSRPSGKGWKAPCPAHDDSTPSLSLTNGDKGQLLWHCFGGCESEDVRQALILIIGDQEPPERQERERQKEKVEDLWKPVVPVPDDASYSIEDFNHKTYGNPSRVWTYRIEGGKIAGWIARYDIGPGEKEVIPYTWCRHEVKGTEQVHKKAMPAQRPLYNLDRILANPDATIVIAEGEKAADACEKLFPEWIPTTIPGGSNAMRLADLTTLANRQVVIFPDHDGPGYDYALKIVEHAPYSADLRMIVWPSFWPSSLEGKEYKIEKGDDAYDHIENGWTRELLIEWNKEAKEKGLPPLVHRIQYLPKSEFEAIIYTENKPS